MIVGSDSEACAVAAEHKGKLAVAERIRHRGDHRGAGHVDRLVALLGDRLGRLHDIGDADRPVVRQRHVHRRVHQLAEIAKHRHVGVERRAACVPDGNGVQRLLHVIIADNE